MDLVVYVPLLLPLCAAAGAWPLATRLPPQVATWLLTSAAVALAALSTAVLGFLALTAVLRIPLVASLGHLSAAVIRREDPASLSAALVATVLLAAVALAAAQTGWRRSRALVRAARQARCLPGSGQVVVVPDGAADAYTVPGWPGRIVVTAGMLDALGPAERDVLLAHERAHADNHHYLFTALSQFAAAANPLLRPVAAAVAYTVERWADETAAGHCGDRRLAARAVGKAALASSRSATSLSRARVPAVATGITGPLLDPVRRLTSRRGLGPVPRRVAALLAPAPAMSPLLVAAAAAVVLVSGVAALDAAFDLHTVVELAQVPSFLSRS
ncbi:MAG TPA: M56 family metallopeptidase [Streptosporangiaceae bacterium]|jgi:Zn-dependent protease with chaperone function|nr:M56 family metallopeptidase [Streptosporangiaceae bacterium]